jgi:hypothetical protein
MAVAAHLDLILLKATGGNVRRNKKARQRTGGL